MRCNLHKLKVTEEIYDRNINNIKKQQIIKTKVELRKKKNNKIKLNYYIKLIFINNYK